MAGKRYISGKKLNIGSGKNITVHPLSDGREVSICYFVINIIIIIFYKQVC